MAQDQTAKRQAIAASASAQATVLWLSALALQELSLEAGQAGNFQYTDFDSQHSPQLSAFLIGDLLSTVVPGIMTALTTQLPGSGPIPRDIILQCKP